MLRGSHDILEAVARRRFNRSSKFLENIHKCLVDIWYGFDNSGNRPVFTEACAQEPMTIERKQDIEAKGQLAMNAFVRALGKACLGGEAYDPDGNGRVYWLAPHEAEKAEKAKVSALNV